MEEVLIILLQILFEVGLEMLCWVSADFTAWSIERNKKPGSFGCGTMFVMFLIGAACGGIMNWIYERPLLPYDWLRIVNLVVGPLLAGGAGWLIAEWRRRRGTTISPSLHFWIGFCFVLGFDLIRFIYARRDFFLP